MKLSLPQDSENVSILVFIQDALSATGAGKTGLAHNTSNFVCYYVRPGSTATQLTLVTQTVTGSHTDGGFVEISSSLMPGFYRLDLSDAMVAGGVLSVGIILRGAAGMIPLPIEIQLSNVPADVSSMLGDETSAIRLFALANTVQAGEIVADGGNTDTTFKTDLSETSDDYYEGNVIAFIANTNNAYQARRISAYNGTTKVVTVTPAFDETPDAGDTFIITGRIN